MSENFWEFKDESEYYPFFAFTNDAVAVFRLNKPIQQYKVEKINSRYGECSAIAIENEILIENDEKAFTNVMLNVNSKRLRKILLEATTLAKKQFPIIIGIKRSGTSLSTQFELVQQLSENDKKVVKKSSKKSEPKVE